MDEYVCHAVCPVEYERNCPTMSMPDLRIIRPTLPEQPRSSSILGLPTIVSSGGWGTAPTTTYPTTYATGPFVYPNASTLLLFLGDYYNFYGQTIGQPTVTDSCGNGWNILAGPTDWAGINYDQRSTVYYVQNPLACPAGDTITVNVPIEEPIFLHFLAVAGSNTGSTPVASAITSPAPGTATTTAPTGSVTLGGAGLLANWIFGDSDGAEVFTPQAGFLADLNSIPTYLAAVTDNVTSSGSYQDTFTITPNPDGWQTVLIGMPASTGTTATPTVTVTPSLSSMTSTQPLTVTVTRVGNADPDRHSGADRWRLHLESDDSGLG